MNNVLLEEVLRLIKLDCEAEDMTAIEEMLRGLCDPDQQNIKVLEAFLPEDSVYFKTPKSVQFIKD